VGLPSAHALGLGDSRSRLLLRPICGIFGLFSTPKQNPALEVLSTPAHPQVTQAVRRLAKSIERQDLYVNQRVKDNG